MEPNHRNFASIPALALIRIVDHLCLRDKIACSKVCRHWQSLICNSTHVWKSVTIDLNSPNGGEWNKTLNVLGEPSIDAAEDLERQLVCAMDEFILGLVETTNAIQNIKISDLRFMHVHFSLEPICKLLMKQKKIVSLNLELVPTDETERKRLKRVLFEVIDEHQSTLECLQLLYCGVGLTEFAKHLKKHLPFVEFPKLSVISYPEDKTDHHQVYNSNYRSLEHCFDKTLKGGNVQRISLVVQELGKSGLVVSKAFESAIRKGFANKLKELRLESVNRGIPELHTMSDPSILIESCPHLTQLHFDVRVEPEVNNHTRKETMVQLLKFYNKNLVSLSCGISNSLAEVIASHCENLTALSVCSVGRSALTNTGLFTLSKLWKLQRLTLAFNRAVMVTANGISEFLTASYNNLKELTLDLPYEFYVEGSIFDSISESYTSLQKLCVSESTRHYRDNYCGRYCRDNYRGYTNVLLEGLQKVVENCILMKYFSVTITSGCTRLDRKLLRTVFQSVVNFQPHLKYFQFLIGTQLHKDDKEFIVKSLPHCNVSFGYYEILSRSPWLSTFLTIEGPG